MALGVPDQLMSLDECGFNIYSPRQFGRAPVGGRIQRQAVGNVTATLVISTELGLVHHRIVDQVTDRLNLCI